MKYLSLIVLLVLGGCAATAGIPSQEFTAEAIDSVQANSSVVNDFGMSTKELILFTLLAGWAIPGPMEMFGMLGGGLFKVFGGVGTFVLKLIGRS